MAASVEMGFIGAASFALLSTDGPTREAAALLLLDVARCVDFEKVPKALDDFRSVSFDINLKRARAAQSALTAAGKEEERAAAADEIAACDDLDRMLTASE